MLVRAVGGRGKVARCRAVVNRTILSIETRCSNGGQSGAGRVVAFSCLRLEAMAIGKLEEGSNLGFMNGRGRGSW